MLLYHGMDPHNENIIMGWFHYVNPYHGTIAWIYYKIKKIDDWNIYT